MMTWKIMVRPVAVVPESVPGIKVAGAPPRLAVTLVAVLALIATMIMAARFGPVPMVNAGVVILVTPKSKPELTALSNATPAGEMFRTVVALWLMAPLVPVTVRVNRPTGELAAVVTVSVEVEVPGLGLNVPVTPVGRPLTLNVTCPAKPNNGVTVAV